MIDQAGLQRLAAGLIERGYHVIGPTLCDNATVLAELESADDLPRGWVQAMTWCDRGRPGGGGVAQPGPRRHAARAGP